MATIDELQGSITAANEALKSITENTKLSLIDWENDKTRLNAFNLDSISADLFKLWGQLSNAITLIGQITDNSQAVQQSNIPDVRISLAISGNPTTGFSHSYVVTSKSSDGKQIVTGCTTKYDSKYISVVQKGNTLEISLSEDFINKIQDLTDRVAQLENMIPLQVQDASELEGATALSKPVGTIAVLYRNPMSTAEETQPEVTEA